MMRAVISAVQNFLMYVRKMGALNRYLMMQMKHIAQQLHRLSPAVPENRQTSGKSEVAAADNDHSLADFRRHQITVEFAVCHFEFGKFIPNAGNRRSISGGGSDTALEF